MSDDEEKIACLSLQSTVKVDHPQSQRITGVVRGLNCSLLLGLLLLQVKQLSDLEREEEERRDRKKMGQFFPDEMDCEG